jgi:hypothetical protein
MGVETGLLVGSQVLGTGLSMYQNNRSLAAQRGENALNREFQAEQNNLDRQFQWRMNQQTMQSQQDFQRQMFDYELQQQSPANQVARLMAAGINPAALLGSSGGVVAAPSVGTPSAAPGATPGSHGVAPTSGLQVPNNSIAQMFSSIAQLQESVAIAKKSGVEASAIETKLPVEIDRLQAEVKKTLTDANLNEALEANNRFDLLLKQTFGYSEKNYQLQKLMSESFKNFASGNLDKAKEELTKVENQLTQYEVYFKKATFDDAVAQVGILRNLYNAQIQTEKSKQAELSASAEEHRASAKEHLSGSALKDAQADFQRFDNDMRKAYKQDVYMAYLQKLLAEGQLSYADYLEAKRKAEVIENVQGKFGSKQLDDALEYIKSKVSIFK